MEKPYSITYHKETVSPNELNHSVTDTKGVIADSITEHGLSLREIWKNRPALISWSFYWSMCAVGW